MKRFLLAALAASGLATGCYTQGDVGTTTGYSAGYYGGYYGGGPDLYYLSPGVSVVAYADYPTFYADNYYWMYRDGLWYSSSYYGGGWAASYSVPTYVSGIRQPGSYTRFQPGRGWVRMHPGTGGAYNPRGYSTTAGNTAPPPASAGRTRGTGSAPPPAARPSPSWNSGGGGWRGGGGGGSGPVIRDHRRR